MNLRDLPLPANRPDDPLPAFVRDRPPGRGRRDRPHSANRLDLPLPAKRRSLLHAAVLHAAVLLGAGTAAAAERPKLEYNRDVRPILTDTCFSCHGPDSASRKADLRLDQREAAVEAKAIVPGQPDASAMLERILSSDPDTIMPPPSSHKVLTPAQKETIKRWIAEGAEYQPHWSFIPPTRPAVPTPKDAAGIRNPIDAFVRAKLDAAGLTPAPEADRHVLARRVALDLTGLPPTPEEVAAFVRDSAPDAYEKYVDRLLAKPAWGEHRARYWLDYARYADTHGIHFDNFREMWTYRDWAISAFNANMPYDRFTIENLAGDLLPNRTLEQQIGSGFNRCNMTTNEGGIIDEEYLVLYARDRTETVAQVWMGLTAGCAVCHDHKFDPLSQREFYSLAAFFNNTTQGAKDGNIKDTPPIITVAASAADRERLPVLENEIAAAKKAVDERRKQARKEFDVWEKNTAALPADALPQAGLYLHAPLAETEGKTIGLTVAGKSRELPLSEKTERQDGPSGKALKLQGGAIEAADVGDFEKDRPVTFAAWVKFNGSGTSGAICARMDNGADFRGWDFWVQRRQVGTHIIHKWPDDALKVVAQKQVPADRWTHVAVSYDGSGKASGVKIYYDGELQKNAVEADKLSSTIRTAVPWKLGQRHASDPLSGGGVQDLRIYERALSKAEVDALAKISKYATILGKPADQRTPAERNELFAYWLAKFDEPFAAATKAFDKLEAEKAAIRARGTIAHVMQEKSEPAMAFILQRGDYDKRGEKVTADTPAILPKFPADAPRNRLGLAHWLLRADHPLTARVTVNRYWQEVFGAGLVRTGGDFGVTGELPSDQALLDWLAVEFRESGWDVKKFFKLMVMSATYRQAATVTPEKLERDRDNRLWSRGPRFRMDAEMIRDGALAASGLLVPTIGGPSVKPYQPPGVWEAVGMPGSNTRNYQRETGPALYRRSLYTFWKRMAPPANLDIFNAPNRELCTVRRERTNTPLQALVTLNDEQFVEAARHLATRTLQQESDPDQRFDFLAMRVLSRSFRPEEKAIVRASLDKLRTFYAAHPSEAKLLISYGESKPDAALEPTELAAWTMLANELLNLDEVLTK